MKNTAILKGNDRLSFNHAMTQLTCGYFGKKPNEVVLENLNILGTLNDFEKENSEKVTENEGNTAMETLLSELDKSKITILLSNERRNPTEIKEKYERETHATIYTFAALAKNVVAAIKSDDLVTIEDIKFSDDYYKIDPFFRLGAPKQPQL